MTQASQPANKGNALRILFDLQPLQGPSVKRGIGKYCMGFLESFLKMFPSNTYFFLLNRSLLAPRYYLDYLKSQGLSFEIVYFTGDQAYDHEAILYSRESILFNLELDAVFILSFFEDDRTSFSSINSFEYRINTLVLLYDLIPLLFHKSYLSAPRALENYLNRLAQLLDATAILAISDYVRLNIETLFPGLKGRTFTVYGGVTEFFQRGEQIEYSSIPKVMEKFKITKPYVIYVAGPDFRKNLRNFLKSVEYVSTDLIQAFHFVIVGDIDEIELNETIRVMSKETVEALIITGRVSDEELRILYKYSYTSIFPSLSEGLGLPLLEAVSCGTSVLSSNNSSLGELNTIVESTFDPNDPNQIADVLELYMRNKELTVDLAKCQAKIFGRYTWAETLRLTMAALTTSVGGIK